MFMFPQSSPVSSLLLENILVALKCIWIPVYTWCLELEWHFIQGSSVQFIGSDWPRLSSDWRWNIVIPDFFCTFNSLTNPFYQKVCLASMASGFIRHNLNLNINFNINISTFYTSFWIRASAKRHKCKCNIPSSWLLNEHPAWSLKKAFWADCIPQYQRTLKDI